MPTLFIIIPFIGIVILNLFYSERFKQFAFGITALVAIVQMCLSVVIIFTDSPKIFVSCRNKLLCQLFHRFI